MDQLPAGSGPGILDWYTMLCGIAALTVLMLHGSTWLALKTDGLVHDKAERLIARVWWIVLAAVAALTIASFAVQPRLAQSFGERRGSEFFRRSASSWSEKIPSPRQAGTG